MRLIPLQETDGGGKLDPIAVRAWLSSAVAERFFNRIYRLDPGSTDSAIRDGFNRCRNLVLDSLVDFEAICNPPAYEQAPQPDYDEAAFIAARNAMLGRTQ